MGLDKFLDEIIVGLLLGDGHIDDRSSKETGNARFHFTQTSLSFLILTILIMFYLYLNHF